MATTTGAEAIERPAPRIDLGRHRPTVVSTLSVLVFLLVWQAAPDLGWVDVQYTSQPSQVLRAFGEVLREDDFFHHAGVSLQEFVIGFALSIAVALPLAVMLGTSKVLRQLLDPPLTALYTSPHLALLPIMIVWLGIGMASKVAMVFLGAVFPIFINTAAGIRLTDPNLVRAARAFGATGLDVFRKVLVPSSLPALLTGIRLGIGRGVLGVVVGEMYVSQAGLGHQITTYGESMRFDRLIVYAVIVSLFGYGLTVLARVVEDRVRTWRTRQ